jgi:tRNA1(Val) A37 N6-methylase TrmN6
MSKNSIYTFDYFQPEEYRFSLDSVFLAQIVANHLKNQDKIDSLQVLDLCAGCGVIGLELSIHLPQLSALDFVEVQSIYREYFENNLTGIHGKNKTHFNFLEMNYEQLLQDQFKDKYDYIVSNPPYFFPGEGMLSPSNFKNRCRFFLDSNFDSYITSILHVLKNTGEAFILVRPGTHHGRNLLAEIQKNISGLASADIFNEVRGTNVIRIAKKS